jgi:hypothetical protein
VAAAGVGDLEPARRAVEQARAQVAFQLGQLAADGGQRHAQPATGGRQAAAVDHGQEHGHGVESVHCYSQNMEE